MLSSIYKAQEAQPPFSFFSYCNNASSWLEERSLFNYLNVNINDYEAYYELFI